MKVTDTLRTRRVIHSRAIWRAAALAACAAAASSVWPARPAAQAIHLAHSQLHHYVMSPTITAVRSGAWSQATTWSTGGTPGNGAKVAIPSGITVTVDRQMTEQLDWINVEGVLRFQPDAVTGLTVHTVVVMSSGQFEMGTTSQPVTGRATLTLSSLGRDFDHSVDPLELTLGLIVMGQARMHGQQKTAWLPVSTAPAAGATRIRPDRTPQGWQQGDRLILTASTHGQEEDLTFQRVEGSDIVFSESLKHTRVFPESGLAVHVGNLSRTVLIRSDPADVGNSRRQAHVMLMSDPYPQDIRWAEFRDLGRTTISPVTDPRILSDGRRDPSLCAPYISAENIRGRYSLHFHHVGERTAPIQHRIQGVSIHVRKFSRLKFGFINHSSNVVVEDSVGAYIDGATFMTEEGNEIGGFYRNLAVFSVGSNAPNEDNPRDILLKNNGCEELVKRRRADMGHNGSGFWVHSAGVDTIGNVAAGHTNAGFDLWTIPLSNPGDRPNAPPYLRFEAKYLRAGSSWPSSMGDTAPLDWVPALFRDNVAYAAGFQRNGRKAGFALSHALHAANAPTLGKSLVDGLVAWNVVQGVDSEYTSNIIWRNLRLIAGNREPGTVGIGLRRQATESNNEVYTARVTGFIDCLLLGDNGQSSDVQCKSPVLTSPSPAPDMPRPPSNVRVVGG